MTNTPVTRNTRYENLERRRALLSARASKGWRPAMQLPGLVLLLLGGLIGWLVRNGRPTPAVDLQILRFFEHHRGSLGISVAKQIEFWDGPKATPYLLVAALVLLFLWGHRLLAFLAVLMTLLAWTPGHFSKYLFPRDRPPASVQPVLLVTGPNSFPSGHTGFITASVVAACFVLTMLGHLAARRVVAVLGVIVIVLVGLSRMLLAVHFPTDVLGGALLAAGISLVVWPWFAWLYAAVDRRWNWWTR